MRKITSESIDAFMSGVEFRKANMTVEVRDWQLARTTNNPDTNWVILSLHGNPIARYPVGNPRATLVCDGNHQSVTTKERLNGIPGVSVKQRGGQWYLNGEEWDGSWTPAVPGFDIKQEGTVDRPKYVVHYPRGSQTPPVQFESVAAAKTFVHVESGQPYIERGVGV